MRTLPPRFQGTFTGLATYCLGMNAVPREGGISSERLLQLAERVSRSYPDVSVRTTPYENPGSLEIRGGNAEQVRQADTLVRLSLKQDKVKFEEK